MFEPVEGLRFSISEKPDAAPGVYFDFTDCADSF